MKNEWKAQYQQEPIPIIDCNEHENEEDGMSLVEYAEKIAPFPLSDFQKELLAQYEECERKNLSLHMISPRNVGRNFIYRVIQEWKEQNELREYRCTCGRLLGRFSGRAEIKCPKCKKVNMIEFQTCFKNDDMKFLWCAQYQQEPIPNELEKKLNKLNEHQS